MRIRGSLIVTAVLLAGCASGGAPSSSTATAARPVATGPTSDLRTPLGAILTTGATTGVPAPLRVDPNARVILSDASTLPAAAYLPSQAARGADVFDGTCARCHQADQFIGTTFVDNWNNRRLYDFYALVRGTMPLDNPGSLKEGEYLDIIAYLLRSNHQQTTTPDSLKADTLEMRKTKIAVK